jgi:hypothetical protein
MHIQKSHIKESDFINWLPIIIDPCGGFQMVTLYIYYPIFHYLWVGMEI